MPDAEEEAYMTIGLIVMAAMMGAMLFMGGHKKGHKHSSSQPPAVEVSSAAAVSTAPVQSGERPDGQAAEPEHKH